MLYFNNIKSTRKLTSWLARIDSLKFDYAFVEETYCLKTNEKTITERYFIKDDTIPKYVFINGQFQDPKSIYNSGLVWYSKNVIHKLTLFPLLDKYSKIEAVQELPYEKRQIWEHGCVVYKDSKKRFVKQRIAELKQTYQIQTLIDKLSGNMLVSVQHAPASPNFETIGYNGVWD